MPHAGKQTGRYPMVGDGPAARHLSTLIDALARRNCTVLIHGESGTGKEVAARQIHARGPRANAPFIPVDCTTLRDTLFESQLFGHLRGAFTGADRSTLGFFRAADGGTLFLDEIAELDPPVQAKLLRCIQEGAVVPLGGVAPLPADVRIIAATHRNLADLAARASFRQDLFYRLNVAQLRIPPLRHRAEDIPPLVRHFLRELAETYDEPVKRISPAAMTALLAYPWPGNVRELHNAIEHALAFSASEELQPEDLPDTITRTARLPQHDCTDTTTAAPSHLQRSDAPADAPSRDRFADANARDAITYHRTTLHPDRAPLHRRTAYSADGASRSLDAEPLPDRTRPLPPPAPSHDRPNPDAPASSFDDAPEDLTMEGAQRRLVAHVLRACNGNQSRAARTLAIERHRLHRFVLRYGLQHLTRPQNP